LEDWRPSLASSSQVSFRDQRLAFPLIAVRSFCIIYPAPRRFALTAMCSLTGQLFSIALLWQAISYQYRVPLIAAVCWGCARQRAALQRRFTRLRVVFGG